MSGRQEDLKLLNAHFHFLVRVLDGVFWLRVFVEGVVIVGKH